MKNYDKEPYQEIMNEIHNILEYGLGLEVEILTWAFMYLKENPNATIKEAIDYGYDEWVK